MGLFRRGPANPDDVKLPAFAFRGRNEETGKKQNYLLRYDCPRCEGLFRSVSALNSHKCKGPS